MTTEGETVTLTEFLLARVKDDERDARSFLAPDLAPVESLPMFTAMGRRLLADCEVKRSVIADEPARIAPDRHSQWERTLRTFATIYSGHPDYDQTWRP